MTDQLWRLDNQLWRCGDCGGWRYRFRACGTCAILARRRG